MHKWIKLEEFFLLFKLEFKKELYQKTQCLKPQCHQVENFKLKPICKRAAKTADCVCTESAIVPLFQFSSVRWSMSQFRD